MATNIVTYSSLEKKFQSIAGLATLDATDKFFFLNNLNTRAKEAWHRFDWPDLIEIKEFPLNYINGQGSKVTDQVAQDILSVWDKNPHFDKTAISVDYKIRDSRVVINPTFPGTKIFALAKKRFVEYTPDSIDVPGFLENYLITSILADFFRGDGQADLASREDTRAEEMLIRQIDRVERQQQQNKPVVQVYPVNDQINSIYQ